MVDLDDILLQMEQEIASGKKSLFGSGVTVDGELLYQLIDKVRAALPDVIREAKYILASNARRREEETQKAQNIVLSAQQRAAQILSQHAIVAEAEREAAAIRQEANEYRARLLHSVRADINSLLTDAEQNLTEALSAVMDGKRKNDLGSGSF